MGNKHIKGLFAETLVNPQKLCVTTNNGLYHISNNMFNKIRLY